MSIKLKKKLIFAVLASIVFIIYYELYFNEYYDYREDDYLLYVHNLWPIITMFLSGSLMAVIFYELEKNDLLSSLKGNLTQNIISAITLFLFFFGFKIFSEFWNKDNLEVFEKSKLILSSVYWSFFVFLMLIGSPNYLTIFFGQTNFLTKCGKYSFGMYLFHPMVMQFFKEFKFESGLERLISVFIVSFCVGYLFFVLVEDRLIKFANLLCKSIEKSLIFI